MLPSLKDQFIADTYFGVLHTANLPLSSGPHIVYDGYGNPSPLKLSTDGVRIGTMNIPLSTGSNGQVLGVSEGELAFMNIFPVGAVFFTATNINPSTFLGGTWVRIGQGRFIAGVGTGTDTVGTSRDILSGNNSGVYNQPYNLPPHRHGMGRFQKNDDHLFILGDWNDGDNYSMGRTTGEDPYVQVTSNGSIRGTKTSLPIEVTGDNPPLDNTPPSLGLYIWQRTA